MHFAYASGRSWGVCLVTMACLFGLTASAALGWGRLGTGGKGDDLYRSKTEARDLLGRWRYQSIAHEGVEQALPAKAASSLDIVACGRRYCGIAVDAEGTCGATLLEFDDRGSKFDEMPETGDNQVIERFSGVLDMHDDTTRNVVFLDVEQDDGAEGQRPRYDDATKLTIVGSSDGTYGRVFPLDMTLSYAGKAACRPPTS